LRLGLTAVNDLIDTNLQSPQRSLMALRMEHANLDALIDEALQSMPMDQLVLQRLKKRRLALKDQITRLEWSLVPDEPA
jgi:hypothetical protein